MIVHTYKSANGKDYIYDFINNLSQEERAEGLLIIEKLENGNLEELNKLDIKHFEGKIWEVKFRKFNRIFYILIDRSNIYLLHACKKQKNRTELDDKKIAIKRAKETLKK